MIAVGQHDQIEVFVGFDQFVNDEQGVVRWDIRIHRAVREQQPPLEVLYNVLVRLIIVVGGSIGAVFEQSLPFFSPVVFILTVVVIPSLGDAHLKEIRIAEQGVRSGIAASGMSVDSGVVNVDPGVTLGELLHPGHLIRQRVVTHIPITHVMKFLGSP